MAKKTKLLFGTDPEAFAVYTGEDGKLNTLPPYFFRHYLGVPVTMTDHQDKHPVFIQGENFKFHEDGAAFEMSITPSHDPRTLWETIQECAKVAGEQIFSQFPDHCMPVLQFLPTIGFEVERWKEEGEDFVWSTRFGCDPDMDATFSNRVTDEIDASKHPFRYSGGHIHLSGSPLFVEDPMLAVLCQMITTGCAAILNSDRPDLDHDRTFMYGKPGKYRVQNYGLDNPFGPEYSIGVEYRTPSSRWASDWKIAESVFKWAEIGVNIFESGLGNELLKEVRTPAIKAILNANQELAGEVLSFVESKI